MSRGGGGAVLQGVRQLRQLRRLIVEGQHEVVHAGLAQQFDEALQTIAVLTPGEDEGFAPVVGHRVDRDVHPDPRVRAPTQQLAELGKQERPVGCEARLPTPGLVAVAPDRVESRVADEAQMIVGCVGSRPGPELDHPDGKTNGSTGESLGGQKVARERRGDQQQERAKPPAQKGSSSHRTRRLEALLKCQTNGPS